MRYIGNKTKLLDEIEGLLRDRGVLGGHFLDVFSGTASVARHFRARGFRVTANDRLRASHVHARAALTVRVAPRALGRRLAALAAAPDREGVVARQYSPLGPAGRRYFTEAHALRIDAALETLAAWRAAGYATESEIVHCLAAVLDASDRVANISGTYGAYQKSWQPNTRGALDLRPPEVPRGPVGRALCEDGNLVVRQVACDVLYVDPPYNEREYAANYHVLEAIAARPYLDAPGLARFEASIYGKTGLLPYEKSAYSTPAACARAFRDLVAGARARHVVVSYSEEGILSHDEIAAALRDGLGARAVERREIVTKRFRSDRDGARRKYRVVPGLDRDRITEWLFHAERSGQRDLEFDSPASRTYLRT